MRCLLGNWPIEGLMQLDWKVCLFLKHITLNTVSCCRKPSLWQSACLIPFPSSLCFLNFTLKNQCVWDISIFPSPLLWLIFSEAVRSPSFLQGHWKVGEGTKLIYLSLSVVLRTSAMEGTCSSPVIARFQTGAPPFIQSTQCPSAPGEWPPHSLSTFQHSPRTVSVAPASRQPPIRAKQRGGWKQIPAFWKGPWWYWCHTREFHFGYKWEASITSDGYSK